jgi:hypothetical protein
MCVDQLVAAFLVMTSYCGQLFLMMCMGDIRNLMLAPYFSSKDGAHACFLYIVSILSTQRCSGQVAVTFIFAIVRALTHSLQTGVKVFCGNQTLIPLAKGESVGQSE